MFFNCCRSQPAQDKDAGSTPACEVSLAQKIRGPQSQFSEEAKKITAMRPAPDIASN